MMQPSNFVQVIMVLSRCGYRQPRVLTFLSHLTLCRESHSRWSVPFYDDREGSAAPSSPPVAPTSAPVRLSYLRTLEEAMLRLLGRNRHGQGSSRASASFRSDELCTLLVGLSLMTMEPRGATVAAILRDLAAAGKLLACPLHKASCYLRSLTSKESLEGISLRTLSAIVSKI